MFFIQPLKKYLYINLLFNAYCGNHFFFCFFVCDNEVISIEKYRDQHTEKKDSSEVRFRTILVVFSPIRVFVPKTLFFRTLDKFFAQNLFFLQVLSQIFFQTPKIILYYFEELKVTLK